MSHRPPAAPSRLPSSRSHESSATSHSSIRRNLFHPNLSKRPGTAASSSSSATTFALNAPDSPPPAPSRGMTRKPTSRSAQNSSGWNEKARGSRSESAGVTDVFGKPRDMERGDIVARDEHGSYMVDTPGMMMPLPGREEGDEGAEDEMRLIEILGRNGELGSEVHGELELKASLAASLHAKVASLDMDNWMFEEEEMVASP